MVMSYRLYVQQLRIFLFFFLQCSPYLSSCYYVLIEWTFRMARYSCIQRMSLNVPDVDWFGWDVILTLKKDTIQSSLTNHMLRKVPFLSQEFDSCFSLVPFVDNFWFCHMFVIWYKMVMHIDFNVSVGTIKDL